MSNQLTENTHSALVDLVTDMLNGRGSMTFHFSQYNKDWSSVTREEALNKANQLAATFGVEAEEDEVNEHGTGGFIVANHKEDIHIRFSYVAFEKEI